MRVRAIEAIIGASLIRMACAYLGLTKARNAKTTCCSSDINAATQDIQAYTGRLASRRGADKRQRSPGARPGTAPVVCRAAAFRHGGHENRVADSTGTATALDITGIRVQGNLIVTPADGAPSGSPVEITGTAGYLAGYDGEHDAALTTLEGICFQALSRSGAATARSMSGAASRSRPARAPRSMKRRGSRRPVGAVRAIPTDRHGMSPRSRQTHCATSQASRTTRRAPSR